MDAKELQSIVMDINQREVLPQEVLSNQVYFYNGKEQKISLALSPEETRELAGNRVSSGELFGAVFVSLFGCAFRSK